MNILILYPRFPEQTFWNTAGSIKFMLGRKAIMPPLGLLTIASYLPPDFSLRLIDRNVSEEAISDWDWADVVVISVMLAQQADYRRCVSLAKMRGKPIAVGGPFTHAMPEVACADADWVCFGEAEAIIDQLISDLRAGRRGRRYQGGSGTNMESVRLPRFELLSNVNDYATMALQFSRGCPFRCEFCDIIEIYGRVPRTKRPEQVCAELAMLERLGFEGYVFLVDDNFIGNKRKAKGMLAELASWNRRHKYPFRYYTEASINLADDEELLERMSDAGFFHVFIGIETPDPELLKRTQKMQNTPGDLLQKLARIRQHGLHITAGFIVGFDGEDESVFEVQHQFIKASGIGVAMVGLLQAIPHTQLSRRLKAEGRLLEELSFSVNLTVEGLNFIPKGEMTKRQYLEKYRELVHALYQPEAYFTRILPALLHLRLRPLADAMWRHGAKLLPVLLKEICYFGIKTSTISCNFWKSLMQIVWKNPFALESFVFDTAFFHHLHQHADYVHHEIARYLSAPCADDVLDQTVASYPVRSSMEA
jgi:radical SAM superfamily enzyme YgiQ (UPF0313 family)